MKKTVDLSVRYKTVWGENILLVTPTTRYPMSWTEGDVWTASVPAEELSDYFYAVEKDGLIIRMEWDNHHMAGEEGAYLSACKGNRRLDSWIDAPAGCPFPRRHTRSDFDRPGFRGAGVAVPVFSLRSEEDFGIGEFRDIKTLADWAAQCGMCIIQLLPVNDTTRNGSWDDSYPYRPVSSFALNPMYVSLQELGVKEDAAFKKLQKKLNSSPSIDYPAVFKAKTALMKECFERKGAADMAGKGFKAFVKDNNLWLKAYCDFSAERDAGKPEFYAWMQYHLHLQFLDAVEYARSKGVSLKGDLPIGVSADSAEARSHPEIFNLDSSAGAPPDFFSADGQNWGFPTYNWESMAKNHYLWWKARLRKMNEYFDAYRIDHILGWFRIWEIPSDKKSGRMGHFNPAIPYKLQEIKDMGLPVKGLFLPDPRHKGCYQPMITPASSQLPMDRQQRFGALYEDFFFRRNLELWRRNAEHKLPELLSACGMLACGEDLGMVPDCVPGVMDHWKILSLEMANMDKGRPWPYFSVCATSSHDMETLRMQHGDPSPEHISDIIKGHFDSSSFLSIHPIQDYLAMDGNLRREDYKEERINDPANPNNHWCYRMHLNLCTLLSKEAGDLNGKIKGMIQRSGRQDFR